MNVVDIVILIMLAFGALAGFKAGVIKKTTDFVGMFIIIVLAFTLKNYVSVIMYENLPFFSFGGFIKGIDVINILMYEVIAFIIVFVVLFIILKVILMVTGLIEKVLKATVILSIPSKLLGIVVGLIEMYVYAFIILVILTLPVFKIPYIRDSKVADFILNDTPILSGLSEEMIDIYEDVYEILDDKDTKTNDELNGEILELLIDKEIITKDSARKLVQKNKVHIDDKSIVE